MSEKSDKAKAKVQKAIQAYLKAEGWAVLEVGSIEVSPAEGAHNHLLTARIVGKPEAK